jgi:GTPase SAR1 family protein
MFTCSDYLFKLLLIGDSGVGKSCLLLRFAVSYYLNCTVKFKSCFCSRGCLPCLFQTGELDSFKECSQPVKYELFKLIFGLEWIRVCFSHSVLMQDDSYLESYISTIGVDFVSNSSACALGVSIMYLYVHQPSYAHVHVLSLIG